MITNFPNMRKTCHLIAFLCATISTFFLCYSCLFIAAIFTKHTVLESVLFLMKVNDSVISWLLPLIICSIVAIFVKIYITILKLYKKTSK